MTFQLLAGGTLSISSLADSTAPGALPEPAVSCLFSSARLASSAKLDDIETEAPRSGSRQGSEAEAGALVYAVRSGSLRVLFSKRRYEERRVGKGCVRTCR